MGFINQLRTGGNSPVIHELYGMGDDTVEVEMNILDVLNAQ